MERRRKKTPRMDGVLDWFFGKRSPEERPKSIFEAFGGPGPSPAPSALPALPAPQGPGLPIVRPEMPPAPARPSMFDVFLPAAPPAPGGEMIPAEGSPGPLIFRSFAPTPPAPVAREPEQPILWFPPEPEMPFTSFFGPFEESVAEAPRFRAGEYSQGVPLWSLTNWNIPTTWEINERIVNDWDPNAIFETVLSEVMTPYWNKAVEESSHYGPATIEIDRVARKNTAFEDFANTFQIPKQVLDLYFGNITTESDAQEASQRFMEEVLNPLMDRYQKVLDIIRPTRELRGWFEFAPDRETGDWWLTYKEAKYRPQMGWAGPTT